jgi:protein phosphatase 1 regulatory subunit 37
MYVYCSAVFYVIFSVFKSITQNIQTLNIGHNRLGNDGIRVLQSGLLKNRSLLRLGLLNTKITAEGSTHIISFEHY